ncbi:hypothetical protein [Pseudomonas putida]|uniref:hypothetical protein n=1 Tax=Pseudomonas putida TaxID=303 RepID=UPI001CD23ED6|nr:hypothetical protein [Pseudomonas putida]
MIDFEMSKHIVRFVWDDEATIAGWRHSEVNIPLCMQQSAVESIANAVRSLCRNGSVGSYAGRISALRAICRYFEDSQIKEFPPRDDQWENHFYSHFEAVISNEALEWSCRKETWGRIRAVYVKLMLDGFVPSSAYIPECSLKSSAFLFSDDAAPLGHRNESVAVPARLQDVLPKKFLIEKGLHLDDDVYLLQLKSEMELAASTVVECCKDYWEVMLDCHSVGERLINSVSVAEIERVLSSGEYYSGGVHLADPRQESGMSWFLAVAKYHIEHDDSFKTVTFSYLEEFPFFEDVIGNGYLYRKLTDKIWEVAGDLAVSQFTASETLGRLLSLLSPRDCCAAASILVSENPVFNASSITGAMLYTQNGKFYLRADTDTRRIIFSVGKPRAGVRKVSSLPTLSTKIVTDVIRCTSTIRKILQLRKNGSWRKLFLMSTRGYIGARRDFGKSMATNYGTTLYDVYEQKLTSVGVRREMFSLYKIRCTQGILEFLRKGTIQAVASKLGNSVQTAGKSYVPKFLLRRWGNRRLRILQQKLILTSTSESPWMLESSDSATEEEMIFFIKKMLKDTRNGDAFSEIVRQRFKHCSDDQNSVLEVLVECELLVVACPQSIGVISAISECSDEFPVFLAGKIERETGLCLNDFRALSDLLSDTASIDLFAANSAEQAIVDKVSGDSIRQYRNIYSQGLAESAKFRDLIESQKNNDKGLRDDEQQG